MINIKYNVESKHKIFGLGIACIGAMLALVIAIVSYDPMLIGLVRAPSPIKIVFFLGIVVISGYAVFTGKKWWYESSFASLGALLFLTINHVGSAIYFLLVVQNHGGSLRAGRAEVMAFNAAVALIFSVFFLAGTYLTYNLVENKDISSRLRVQKE